MLFCSYDTRCSVVVPYNRDIVQKVIAGTTLGAPDAHMDVLS